MEQGKQSDKKHYGGGMDATIHILIKEYPPSCITLSSIWNGGNIAGISKNFINWLPSMSFKLDGNRLWIMGLPALRVIDYDWDRGIYYVTRERTLKVID